MSLDLLIAHEDERRRVAEALHEDLAQTLAAAMLGLRRLERSDALDDVHRQLLRVLDDVRGIATALRPPALGQLGLVPALQGLGLTVHAHGVPEPLPEPLRTGVYRLVHEALAGTPRATPALLQLRTAAGRLEVRAGARRRDQPRHGVRLDRRARRVARGRAAPPAGALPLRCGQRGAQHGPAGLGLDRELTAGERDPLAHADEAEAGRLRAGVEAAAVVARPRRRTTS